MIDIFVSIRVQRRFKSNDLNEQANRFSLFYTRTAVTINTRVFLNEE